MNIRGIPKTRIGPPGEWERSIRMRQCKGVGRAFNAAERSVFGYESASLCGIREEIKRKEILKGGDARRVSSEIGFGVILRRSRRISISFYEILHSVQDDKERKKTKKEK